MTILCELLFCSGLAFFLGIGCTPRTAEPTKERLRTASDTQPAAPMDTNYLTIQIRSDHPNAPTDTLSD